MSLPSGRNRIQPPLWHALPILLGKFCTLGKYQRSRKNPDSSSDLPSRYRNARRPAAPGPSRLSIPLHGHHKRIQPAEPHAALGPLVKVLLGADGAAHSLLRADGPVLLEGARAFDGGLVGARAGEDLEGAFVVLRDGEVPLRLPRFVGR